MARSNDLGLNDDLIGSRIILCRRILRNLAGSARALARGRASPLAGFQPGFIVELLNRLCQTVLKQWRGERIGSTGKSSQGDRHEECRKTNRGRLQTRADFRCCDSPHAQRLRLSSMHRLHESPWRHKDLPQLKSHYPPPFARGAFSNFSTAILRVPVGACTLDNIKSKTVSAEFVK